MDFVDDKIVRIPKVRTSVRRSNAAAKYEVTILPTGSENAD